MKLYKNLQLDYKNFIFIVVGLLLILLLFSYKHKYEESEEEYDNFKQCVEEFAVSDKYEDLKEIYSTCF